MKEGKLIRFMIVALPLGLLILGIGSMVIYHMRKPTKPIDPNEDRKIAAARMSQKAINAKDTERFLQTIADTIGERHLGKPTSLEQAAVWIESTMGSGNLGYPVERHIYEVNGSEVRNLIAELPGKSRRDEIIVVGAHYDSVANCPGANDNGSGVAALLSIAQAMAGEQQARTIRFAFFVNEEPPYFQTESMGSRVYAKRCRAREEKIVAMMSFDTIGYYRDEEESQKKPEGLPGNFPTVGNFLAFVGDQDSRYFVDAAGAAFRSASEIPVIAGAFPVDVPGVGWSDHWSFWQEGYPGVMVTDTAPYRYPHYHQPTDTADQVSIEKLVQVAQGLEAAIKAWANP